MLIWCHLPVVLLCDAQDDGMHCCQASNAFGGLLGLPLLMCQ